jgi:hypothetical protein
MNSSAISLYEIFFLNYFMVFSYFIIQFTHSVCKYTKTMNFKKYNGKILRSQIADDISVRDVLS